MKVYALLATTTDDGPAVTVLWGVYSSQLRAEGAAATLAKSTGTPREWLDIQPMALDGEPWVRE